MDTTQVYLDVLKKWWGYDSFRPSQLDAVAAVAAGRDTLALMPTGGGKSILYQVPALAMDGVCIVITPLIALMKDQVDRLKKLGIKAVAIHSGMTTRQIDYAFDNCVYGDVKFLYVAPERVAGELFRLRVLRMKVSIVAVDEAHCISQWGYDFRPSYLRIAEIRKLCPDATFIALTASATGEVVKDILRHLKMEDALVIRSSFERKNLSYVVREGEDKQSQLLRVVNNVKGSGIVYVRTREETENFARMLTENGVSADYYNGGMTSSLRSEKQEAWMSGKSRVMVSTNAFGMGIDKSDVRFVVHYEMPESLEAYYQEAGRAGRDGERSYAVLLSSEGEEFKAQKRFENSYPPIDTIKTVYEALFNYLQLGIGEGKLASYEFNIYEFSKKTRIFGATALNAIDILSQNGYMTLTDAADRPARITFMVTRDELYKIRLENEDIDHILRVLLRLYDGVFHGFVPIDLKEISSMSGYNIKQVMALLEKLWTYRVIRYIPSSICSLLIFNEQRLPIEDVYISPESYQIRKKLCHERLVNAYAYVKNIDKCRSRLLQEYFGSEDVEDCGVCDICLENKRKGVSPLEGVKDQILELLTDGELNLRVLVAKISLDPKLASSAVDQLVEQGMITVDEFAQVKKI